MIHALTDLRLTVAPGGWSPDAELGARIARHWESATRVNPKLWNGRVFWTVAPDRPAGVSLSDGVLSGTVVETDFAAFLAWRDWGFPDLGVRNLFGSALVTTSDGALVYGVMGAQTANGGRIYPPGGSLEPRDVDAHGRVDVIASIETELLEETGLDHREAVVEGLLAAFDGPRISVGRILRFPLEADALVARIRAFLAAEDEPELDDVVILRRPEDAWSDRYPGYARMFADRLLGT